MDRKRTPFFDMVLSPNKNPEKELVRGAKYHRDFPQGNATDFGRMTSSVKERGMLLAALELGPEGHGIPAAAASIAIVLKMPCGIEPAKK
jgi:hypothetical protein